MAIHKIQFRRDTAANWTSANPVLSPAELGFELGTQKIKLGDGITHWNDLEYSEFADIVDSLDSTDANKVLSALQGKVLNEKKPNVNVDGSDINNATIYIMPEDQLPEVGATTGNSGDIYLGYTTGV